MRHDKHKNTKINIVDEKIEKFLETLFWPIFQLLKYLFKIIAFIFWRNKYSKQYWDKRRVWKKQMIKLRSKAQKEIMLTTFIPTLESQGFERFPDNSYWGWDPTYRGYSYRMAKLKNDELQKISIYTIYGYPYFMYQLDIICPQPTINSVSEMSEYTPLVFPWREKRYIKQLPHYKIKHCRTEKALRKRVEKIKTKMKKKLSNTDKIFEKPKGYVTQIYVPISEKEKINQNLVENDGKGLEKMKL